MFWLTVCNNINNDRFDKYLSGVLWLSRSFMARLIEAKYIYIAKITEGAEIFEIAQKGKIFPKKSYIPARWDNIYIDNMDRFDDAGILAESPNIKIDILYSNHPESSKSDYLIIYKPKWVLSHPNSVWDVTSPSVSWRLYHNFGKLTNIWNFIRAGLVHRLDKETDGLMIVVLTETWLKHFQNLFHSKSTAGSLEDKEKVPFRKFYRAICDVNSLGRKFLGKVWDNLPFMIIEAVIPKIPHYNRDSLWITKILNFGESANDQRIFIYIEILTWKTHQIRYHLSKYWLPIVGDYLYNINCKSSEKMQLTSCRLEWIDIDNKYKILELDSLYLQNNQINSY